MKLTGKQKTYLRGLGQKLHAVGAVGKAGLTDALIRNIGTLLDRHELIKVHVPAGPERKDIAAELAAATQSDCAGLVGRMALLYRPNETLPADRRIQLPV